MSYSFLGRGRKLVVLAIVLPVLAAWAVVGSISPASAWHPEISGQADCKGIVSFKVTSWNQGVQGTNTKIGVYYSVDNGTTFTPVTPVDGDKIVSSSGVTYEFTLDNKNSFSDNIQLPSPLPAKVTLKATSLGTWGGNHKEVSSRTSVVTLPAPCAKPTASITGPSCTSTDAVVSLKNTGGTAVEFSIFKDDSTTAFKKVSVAANGTEEVKITVDKQTKISVRAEGLTNVDKTVSPEADCNKPSATVVQQCSTDGSGWVVTLKNEGKLSETFTVKSGDKTLDTIEVAAGKTQTKSYTFDALKVEAGKSIKIDVLAGSRNVASVDVKNDCVGTSADVKLVCEEGGAVFTFTNSGKLPESFSVTVNDGEQVQGSPVKVDPGKTETYLLALQEDESGVIHIKGENSGLTIDENFKYDCTQPPTTTSTSTTVPPTTSSTIPPTEVLSEQIVRPQLAETGVSVTPMMMIGGLLMLAGFGLLQLRRTLAGARS